MYPSHQCPYNSFCCENVDVISALITIIMMIIITRRVYWRRLFKTAKRSQAPGDATVRKRFFCDNFVIFCRISKTKAFLESLNFSTCPSVCKFSIFVMVTWPLFGTRADLVNKLTNKSVGQNLWAALNVRGKLFHKTCKTYFDPFPLNYVHMHAAV